MHSQSAITDFTYITQDKFSAAVHKTITEMALHAGTYPSPPVVLDPPSTPGTLSSLLKVWDDTLAKPIYEAQTGDLKNARATVQTAVTANGKYVNTIAKGDVAKLAESGFPVSKLHAPVGDLAAPNSVKVEKGDAHLTFYFNIETVEHARGYLIAYTPAANTETDPNNWTIRWAPSHTITLAGFVADTKYKFAACAAGSSKNLFFTHATTNLYAL